MTGEQAALNSGAAIPGEMTILPAVCLDLSEDNSQLSAPALTALSNKFVLLSHL